MQRRGWWLVVGLVVMTAALFVSGLLQFPLAPLRVVVTPLQQWWARRESPPTLTQLVTAQQEQLVRLNAENADLKARLLDYQQIRGEGHVTPTHVVVARARILSRSWRQGQRYCELDVGGLDGVAPGMAVCLGWSLVGVVTAVSEARAAVQAITDQQCRIPAAIVHGDQILAEGVLSGGGRRARLRLEYVEDRDGMQVLPQQAVITAGGDGRFPRGLVLGTITNATRSLTADHWAIEVQPLRELDTSDTVLVLRFPPKAMP